jgi:hypothetical protein
VGLSLLLTILPLERALPPVGGDRAMYPSP